MLGGHGRPVDGFSRHRGLIALAIGGAVAEACLLTIFAPAVARWRDVTPARDSIFCSRSWAIKPRHRSGCQDLADSAAPRVQMLAEPDQVALPPPVPPMKPM